MLIHHSQLGNFNMRGARNSIRLLSSEID